MKFAQAQREPARQAAAATAVRQDAVGGAFCGSPSVQRLQALSASLNAGPRAVQLAVLDRASSGEDGAAASSPEERTGLPDDLKAGVERLSGLSMDAVRVHYNSPQPAQMQALAYTQGTDIHVAPGQERHLPHEAWHVVQQQQGRVRPTRQLKGIPLNDSAALESEADAMGRRAVQMMPRAGGATSGVPVSTDHGVVQRVNIEGVGENITVDQVVNFMREHLDLFEYRYHDYINDKSIREIVRQIDGWGDPYNGWEGLISDVKASIDESIYHYSSGMEVEEAPVTVEVENVGNRYNGSLDEGELARQVAGQVAGLNQMTAADWLRNVLINRMKTLDTLSGGGGGIGTKAGSDLGGWINDTLKKNDGLARFVMNALIDNLAELAAKYEEYRDSPLIGELHEAALIAAGPDEGVFTRFEILGGLRMMGLLNQAGLQGGLGRAHGKGDEKWFRGEFYDGVALLRGRHPELDRNAILHNPDQCAGGEMEVGGDEYDTIQEAMREFRAQFRQYHGINSRLSNIGSQLNSLRLQLEKSPNTGDQPMEFFGIFGNQPIVTRNERIDNLQAEATQLRNALPGVRKAMQVAAERYCELLHPHVGNSAVNSHLGRQWMEPRRADQGRSRVESMLRQVLAFAERSGLDALENRHLDVRYRTTGDADPDAGTVAITEPIAEDDVSGIGDGKAADFKQLLDNPKFFQEAQPKGSIPRRQFSKYQLEVLGQSAGSGQGHQQSLEALALKGKPIPARATFADLRRYFTIGYASGQGMNCLIRAVLLALGRPDGDDVVRQIRVDAMNLGLVGSQDMFDLHRGGGAAVLQRIVQESGGGYTLQVIQIGPQGGRVLSRDTIVVNGGGPTVTILHMGAHFTPLYDGNLATVDAWLASNPDIQQLHYDL